MLLCIADVLSSDDCRQVNAWLDNVPHVDGRTSAGWHAREVKRNRQAEGGNAASLQADRTVQSALRASQLFMAAALPRHIQSCLFARYSDGMHYGPHVDDAIMADIRTDIAVTVFLNSPADYSGGELVIDTTAGEQAYKLPAGHAIIYPATSLHQITAVTHGERRVAVTWVQSLVRASEQRQILFDVDVTRRQLYERDGKSPLFDNLARVHANLLRQWAET